MTNADKVHAINQLVGDHEMPTCWGFGKRRVKGTLPRAPHARILDVAFCKMVDKLTYDGARAARM